MLEMPKRRADRLLALARSRIERQRELVATLQPGSVDHRLATEVLLTFQDTLHVLIESFRIVEEVRRGHGDD